MNNHFGFITLILVSGFLLADQLQATPADQAAKAIMEDNPGLEYLPGRVLVRFKADAPPGLVASARGLIGTADRKPIKIVPGLERLDIGMDVPQAVAYLSGLPFVEYAEPDYVLQAATIPDDVYFGNQWALNNTGQNVVGVIGTNDADMDMPEAWDTMTGNGNTVIAVIDTGTQWDHPDLAGNIWSNPNETLNGIDDDGNGYVDDIQGWDFYSHDNNPTDSSGHGTHTAGTICAQGNNGEGVAGVLWSCKIMPLRFLGNGGGSTSDAVLAIKYAVDNGAKISSNSWGSYSNSSSLHKAISNAASAGHVFIAAAGNDSSDNDGNSSFYPASFGLDSVISVAATDSKDNLASFSNYGSNSVDVGAPGVFIISTNKGSGYTYKSGTSMATPHVAGLVALVQEQNPGWSYQQVINQVLSTVRPVSSLQGNTVTGGIIDAAAALTGSAIPPPEPEPEPEPTTLPMDPENLAVGVDTTTGIVTLSWEDMSDNEAGFEIQREKYHNRRNKWVGTSLISSVSADTVSTTDSPGDGTFHYRVRSYNSAGSSDWTLWSEDIDVSSSGGGSDGGGGGKDKPCRGKACNK